MTALRDRNIHGKEKRKSFWLTCLDVNTSYILRLCGFTIQGPMGKSYVLTTIPFWPSLRINYTVKVTKQKEIQQKKKNKQFKETSYSLCRKKYFINVNLVTFLCCGTRKYWQFGISDEIHSLERLYLNDQYFCIYLKNFVLTVVWEFFSNFMDCVIYSLFLYSGWFCSTCGSLTFKERSKLIKNKC